jgi:hypothetical protein
MTTNEMNGNQDDRLVLTNNGIMNECKNYF